MFIRSYSILFILISLQCFYAYKPDSYLISKYGFVHYHKTQAKLSSLTKHERKNLDTFFKYSMACESGAYTLFGHKPLTLICHMSVKHAISEQLSKPTIIRCAKFERGYKTWLEKRTFFQGKTYDLTPYASRHTKNSCHCLSLSNTSMLDTQLNLPHDLEDHFRIGMLMGFGKKNAENFVRRIELRALATQGDKVAEHELEEIKQKLIVLPKRMFIQDFFIPGFVGDPSSEETKRIIDLRKRERKYIRNLYANRDFLLVTLLELSDNR